MISKFYLNIGFNLNPNENSNWKKSWNPKVGIRKIGRNPKVRREKDNKPSSQGPFQRGPFRRWWASSQQLLEAF
jgi:hypothetical protein